MGSFLSGGKNQLVGARRTSSARLGINTINTQLALAHQACSFSFDASFTWT